MPNGGHVTNRTAVHITTSITAHFPTYQSSNYPQESTIVITNYYKALVVDCTNNSTINLPSTLINICN